MAGKDRKKEIARLRFERQQERRARRDLQARRLKVIGAIVAVVVVLGGGSAVAVALNNGSGSGNSTAAAPTSTPSSAAAAPVATAKPGQCAYHTLTGQAAQSAKNVGMPPVVPTKGTYQMTIDTNFGKIVVALDQAKAPCTVNSFNYLAGKKFFDNTICHRLTTQGLKVLQCGDPTGTGSGGPSYGFANEYVPPPGNPNSTVTYPRGVIAMAHSSDPNSNGSQFFIVYGNSPLPDDYTIFGNVTQGLDIVDNVAKAGTSDGSGDGTPKKKTEIKDLSVTKS